jgi:hypothetical protein
MFEAAIWTLQTKHETNLSPFPATATKKSATLCLTCQRITQAAY